MIVEHRLASYKHRFSWRAPVDSRWIAVAVVLIAFGTGQPSRQGNVEGQTRDLAVFEQKFFAVDQSYAPSARTQATERLRTLHGTAGHVSDVRFVLELAQIVALADNGHTSMLDRGTLPGMSRVGLRLAPFGSDFYVIRATNEHAELIGARLVAIDDTGIDHLRSTARLLRGGVTAWRDRLAPALFESPAQLFAMGLTRSSAQATYHLARRDGTTIAIDLHGETEDPGPPDGVRVLDPVPDPGWTALVPESLAPWALQDFSTPFRRRDAPDLDAMVIQLHGNIDLGGQSITAFLEDADRERRAAHRRNVVLDMRFNGGGNLMLTRTFMQSLPSRLAPDGRVIVLMSPWTFSAAISSIGYLKQAGGDRVVLAGEAPGDRLQFWAEGAPVRLPYTGATVLVATRRHDYLTGCRGFPDCFFGVRDEPIAVARLTPDVNAPWDFDAYAAGRDPGMEAAARLLRQAHLP